MIYLCTKKEEHKETTLIIKVDRNYDLYGECRSLEHRGSSVSENTRRAPRIHRRSPEPNNYVCNTVYWTLVHQCLDAPPEEEIEKSAVFVI